MKYKILAIAALFLSLPLLAGAQTKPKVTRSQAEQAALASVKGEKILSGEYEMEGGKHVWSFDVRTSGAIKEVWVDPVSGMVIKIENESKAHEKSERPKEVKTLQKSKVIRMHHSSSMHGISKNAAEKLALKAVKGGKVLMAKKVRREKILVWSVDIKTSKGEKDVWVSPENGRVLHISAISNHKTMNKN